MRPFVLALALVGPLCAEALETPGSGKIIFDGTSTEISYINIATCTGVANAVRGSDDAMNVDLTWTTQVDATTVPWAEGGTYYLYVTNQAPDTSGSDALSCTQSSNSSFTSQPVGNNAGLLTITNDAQSMISAVSVSRAAIAAALATIKSTAPCDQTLAGTVNLCVQWFPMNSSTAGGRATGAMTIDLVAPTDAPTGVTAGAGDTQLHVGWTGIADADRYKAIAIAETGAQTPHGSGEVTGDSTTITGLVNNVTYDVSVYALDVAGNPGPAGTTTGTPQPVDDFWHLYKKMGGQETGGCGAGAGGALALLAAATAALRATRRRKP
jgi:hypothetical protein